MRKGWGRGEGGVREGTGVGGGEGGVREGLGRGEGLHSGPGEGFQLDFINMGPGPHPNYNV